MTTEATQTVVSETASSESSEVPAVSSDATSAVESEPAAAPADAGSEAPAGAPAPKIEVPERYRGEDGKADLAKLIARVAEADKTPEGVPDTPENYDLTLAEEVKVGDQALTIDKDNPLVKEALADFHAAGLSQEKVTKLFGTYAKALAADLGSMRSATEQQVQAEIAKLGPKAGERISGALSGLSGVIGNEPAETLLNDIRSQAGFEALEALISKFNGSDESGRTPAGSSARPERSTAEILYPNQARKA